jgi:hypothetical protein
VSAIFSGKLSLNTWDFVGADLCVCHFCWTGLATGFEVFVFASQKQKPRMLNLSKNDRSFFTLIPPISSVAIHI